ncbi:D-amino acid aminotransferase [Gammaproteobacteria bacterium AB-CW1]|uniref:Aminodeoxychorismate lyase n=1 Tax=Natronospira elongata TaxID=3110268 RepID=A0AAP6JEH5_9GAMM|nr:D-amino acid aminotransferase [Gammaproteobacteria bacterium AB-CW1]
MAIPLPTAWLNGEFLPVQEARISPLDRGFLFGDAVYEVIPVYDGQPFRLDEHLARLENSLKAIRLSDAMGRQRWRDTLLELVERNGGGDQNVYLQVSRGTDKGREHGFPAEPIAPTCFAMSSPLPRPPAHLRSEGARAHLVEDLRWRRCDIKATTLLPNILAKQAAHEAGADEALLHRDGELIEGSSMTLFLVKDGVIHTPPQSSAILPGITRQVVLELAHELGISVQETALPLEQLEQADELWFSSSSREIMPVTRVDEQTIGEGRPGPVWARVQAALEASTRQGKKQAVS